MTLSHTDDRTSARNLIISWRALAVSLAMLSLASLAVLIVIVTVRDVDILSVVALLLAVLAFIIQIIVYIAQAAATNDNAMQAREIYASMGELLGRIEERASGTQATVATISDRLLEVVLGKAIREAGSISPDQQSPEFAEAVAERVARTLGGTHLGWAPRERTQDRWQYPNRVPSPDDPEITRLLETYPPEDQINFVASELAQLDESDLGALARLAADEIQYRRPQSLTAPGLYHIGSEALLSRGLIEEVPGMPGLRVLTPNGRKCARLFTAKGPEPSYLSDPLRRLRQGLATIN